MAKILCGHPLAGLLWERQFEEVLLGLGLEEVPSWECLFVHRKLVQFSSVYVDDVKMSGRKQNMAPMWNEQTMAVGIEFVFHMVEMARLLVVFLKNKKVNEEASKSLGKERRDPLLTVLWRKPPKTAFKNSIYFVTERSFTADGGLL